MNTQFFRHKWRGAGLLSLGLALGFQGCGGDDNSEPAPIVNAGAGGGVSKGGGSGTSGSLGAGGTTVATGGANTDAGAPAGGVDSSGGTNASGGTTTTGQGGTPSSQGGSLSNQGGAGGETIEPINGGAGGEGGGANICENPVGPGGCYACKPDNGETLQFLNRCSDSQCSKFDNAARIQGYTGTLPSLQ